MQGPHSRGDLAHAHDRFLATGLTDPSVRPVVAESWRRSLRGGLDPEAAAPPVDLLDEALERWRDAHPLARVMPMIRRLLVEESSDFLVAISDAAGRLMWVEGPGQLKARMESIRFVEGALWSEAAAGTNAPGTALALDAPVQIVAAEHLSRSVTPWSCAAAPIHDPQTGAMLGALDVSGGDDVASPHALAIVRATVAAVESELRVQRLLGRSEVDAGAGRAAATVRTLGMPTAVIDTVAGTTRLGLRHSELVVLLASHREGLSGDSLAVMLREDEVAPVTLRAELSRLRSLLAVHGLELAARPYRLDPRLRLDLDEVRELVRCGDLSAAVDLYRGDLLPGSEAPGVRRLRERLRSQVRAALIAGGDPDALLRFADTDHGRDDWDLWRAAVDTIGPSSPRYGLVRDHVATLDRDLGERRPRPRGAARATWR